MLVNTELVDAEMTLVLTAGRMSRGSNAHGATVGSTVPVYPVYGLRMFLSGRSGQASAWKLLSLLYITPVSSWMIFAAVLFL